MMLTIAVIMSLAPFALVLINAFKSHTAIVQNPLALPESVNLANFRGAWKGANFTVGIGNSLILTLSTVFITVLTATLAAFPLARRRIASWKLISIYFLVSVTVPIQLFLFPLYFLYARLGLVGNLCATSVILAAINLPLAILLLRTYVLTIPAELDDAALMDAMVFSSALGRRKPAPEVYQAALEAVGVEADRALFVGDRVREDYEGPRSVGMRAVICVAHATEPPPDGIPTIASLKDLPGIL